MILGRTRTRFIRPRNRRGRVIGASLLALLLLVGAADCYRFDDRAFADAYVRVDGGEVEVSLTGNFGPGGADRGSPYEVMVRYLTRDSAVVLAEVASLSLRAAEGGTPVLLRSDSAERFRPGDGIGWASTNVPVPGGDRFAAFLLGTVPLAYGDHVASGRLRLTDRAGVRDVPFSATLRPRRTRELRSRFWDAAGSV